MARQREVTIKKQVKYIQVSSRGCLLARTRLHQKILVQVSSLCRHVTHVTPAAPQADREGRNKLQKEDAAFAR